MKKPFITVFCAAGILMGCATTGEQTSVKENKGVTEKQTEITEETSEEDGTMHEEAMVGMANPFETKGSLDAANKAAGFTLVSPKTFSTYTAKVYRVIRGEMIEIIYTDSANKDEDLRVRKGVGNLDISGDYNKYEVNKSVNDSGIEVLLRGEADSFHVASWISGDYAFAIDSKSGISENKVLALIQEIN